MVSTARRRKGGDFAIVKAQIRLLCSCEGGQNRVREAML
jgi:hypothetical protein